MSCNRLARNNLVEGIAYRMRNGIKEGTTYAYYGASDFEHALRKKTQQADYFRLRGLTQGRALAAKTAALSQYKRFLVAVGSKRVDRVDKVITIGLKQRMGIGALTAQYMKAALMMYRPKSFEEEDYARGVLLLKLGGDRIAEIAHRCLATPGISTLRSKIQVPAVIPSPGKPTVEEVSKNVANTFTGLEEILKPTGGPKNRHAVLMFDELATEKRIRWDSKTNKFLGICREHGHKVSLDFGGDKDMEQLFESLDDGEIHHAAEVRRFGSICSRDQGTDRGN